jgi:hypothetical protein
MHDIYMTPVFSMYNEATVAATIPELERALASKNTSENANLG